MHRHERQQRHIECMRNLGLRGRKHGVGTGVRARHKAAQRTHERRGKQIGRTGTRQRMRQLRRHARHGHEHTQGDKQRVHRRHLRPRPQRA
ncbi:hypothetical protein SDC9_120138 [bioreactor metagenome]|uniref:Uncharacterized protein n=1 Tax=bioreactor metagenome TaxID=1076179 RepID=A0A645C662_9ZZZZ